MKSILFLFLCIGLRIISCQPTKARTSVEEPMDTLLNQMAEGSRALFAKSVWNAMMSDSGNTFDMHAECLKLFGQKDGLHEVFDRDMIPIEQACKVMVLMTEIPMAQGNGIKAFGNFYRYFDENKDGELSSAEAFVPMGLLKALGYPMEDIFGKHEESGSIEGNHFAIQHLCTVLPKFFFSL